MIKLHKLTTEENLAHRSLDRKTALMGRVVLADPDHILGTGILTVDMSVEQGAITLYIKSVGVWTIHSYTERLHVISSMISRLVSLTGFITNVELEVLGFRFLDINPVRVCY